MIKGKPALTDEEAHTITKQWEADGYVFRGNGFLDRDDPPECPACRETGYFYALWEHPTIKTTVTSPEGESFSFTASHCFNRCYECDHAWIDDETEGEQS